MSKIEFRLRGYESFIIREGWIAKGIEAIKNSPKIFQAETGHDYLGVGANMAKAIRYWLKASGLAVETAHSGMALTHFGEIVSENDPYVEDIFTLWLLHVRIASNYALATSWSVFFNELDLTSFTKDEMIQRVKNILNEQLLGSSLPERSIKDDCNSILSMYTANKSEASVDPELKNHSPFAALNLIARSGDVYEKTSPNIRDINPLAFMSIIADTLNVFGGISIDEIVSSKNMPGKLLNLNRVEVNVLLDMLEDMDYIYVNRTAGLDHVYPKQGISAEDAIVRYYEGRTNGL